MIDEAPYQPNPHYPPVGGQIVVGWDAAVAFLPDRDLVLAIDGPAVLDWDTVASSVAAEIARRGRVGRRVDTSRHWLAWPDIVAKTTTEALADDPDFAKLADVSLADLFQSLPEASAGTNEIVMVVGPGASLAPADVIWYVDLPKRHADAAVNGGNGLNLGQRNSDGPATTRRLFYIDWTILDRHRESIMHRLDLWIDAQDPNEPKALDGETLKRTMSRLARQPFRTRPTFNTAPWGGHWGQRRLGVGRDAENTALGYELIAPESGVLIGDDTGHVEVPFQSLVASHAREVLGRSVHARFGTSFPVRFDYLDTVDGGNLSVHCHPQDEYMSSVFGWPYTQHETYYVMVGGGENRIFLGLRADVDVDAFHRAASSADEQETPFDIDDFVQTFPATPHQLFMIPAGTPHGSGVGNVVLEVSATPYLYSLRFYDWLRRDSSGTARPVHVGHAFANLDDTRRGEHVDKVLVQEPETLRSGQGWREERLGSLTEMFFEIRRLVIEGESHVDEVTHDRFHVLNVVEGQGIRLETADDVIHDLNYAETLVVPAAVGSYTIRRGGDRPVRVVKAFVK